MTRAQLEHARELARYEWEKASAALNELIAKHVAACVPAVEAVDRAETELRRIDEQLARLDERREEIDAVWADVAQRAREGGL